MFYFTYGSNMSTRRLLQRTPSARFISAAYLPGHELRFHKKSRDGSAKCDALETNQPQHFVYGALVEIAPTEKAILDQFEGLGNGYEEKQVTLIAESNARYSAFTYYATHIDSDLRPYDWYKHHVLIGAKEHGLPDSYLEIIAHTISIPDPHYVRHEREMMIYSNHAY